MITVALIVGMAGCGSSSEPSSCTLCGTWYSRYDANGAPIAHDANRSLTLGADANFVEILGTPPGFAGTWAATSTHLVLSYSGTGPETGVIVADSISFPTHSIFYRRIYAR